MTDGEARGQCPLCGTTKCLEVREASDPRFGLPGRFKVLWCPKCDIGSTHPRLTWTELQRYYPDAYDPYRGHTWLSEISRVHRFLIAAEDRFGAAATDRVRPRTLLDVGCGNGAYMAEMAQRGFTVTGVEISPLASKVVMKRGFPVVSGDFLTATLPREAFDVVTMNHYLEHCLDPRANLKKAHELLKEGGHLIVGVPNFSSWPSRHSDLTGLILNCRVTRFILVRRALFACWRPASSASRTSATSRPQTPGRSQPAFSSSLESARIPLCRGCIRFFTWYSILWEFLFPCSVNPHGFASCRRRQKPKQPRTGSGRSEYGPEKWAHLLIPFFGRTCEVSLTLLRFFAARGRSPYGLTPSTALLLNAFATSSIECPGPSLALSEPSSNVS